MLDPTTLCSLELGAAGCFGIERFLKDSVKSRFHHLHTLSLSFVDTDFHRIHACIAGFPAICDLSVTVRHVLMDETDADSAPRTPLAPHLQRYAGPIALLPSAFAGAAPTHLEPSWCAPAELVRTLRSTDVSPSVTSLSVAVRTSDVVETEVLEDMLAIFPYLTHFSLVIWRDDWDHKMLDERVKTEIVSAALLKILKVPEALEHVRIQWTSKPPKTPPFDELRDLLHREVPSLHTVDLSANLNNFQVSARNRPVAFHNEEAPPYVGTDLAC
ncbi:hypothetical protein C8R44DRAFT_726501 [Mycena epipterygia]|nr:hypothetical protein C8R44DRAFT_726501 [Mycena epipterygia]